MVIQKVLSQLRNLTSSLFGIAAGILGLEAYSGFLFYLLGTSFVSGLVWMFLAGGAAGHASRYFGTSNVSSSSFSSSSSSSSSSASASKITEDGEKPSTTNPASNHSNHGDGWTGGTWKILTEDVIGGLSSFVLTWTLFYGLVRV